MIPILVGLIIGEQKICSKISVITAGNKIRLNSILYS